MTMIMRIDEELQTKKALNNGRWDSNASDRGKSRD